MRKDLQNVEAGKLTEGLVRRGIPLERRLRVIVESVDEKELPMAAINAAGGPFDRSADESELYSDRDLVERYR